MIIHIEVIAHGRMKYFPTVLLDSFPYLHVKFCVLGLILSII